MEACHGIFKLNTKGFYTQNGAGEVGGGLWEYYYNIEYEMRNLLCALRRILLRNCSEPKLHRAEIAVRNCVPDTSRALMRSGITCLHCSWGQTGGRVALGFVESLLGRGCLRSGECKTA